jgi:ABC-type transporter Mla maintaining outer membrane lipid asymmetry ATPase subunit MlaF
VTRETPAVAVEHLSFAFGDHVVLSDVSFSVPKGSMTMLLGASGAGKSVLLKLILGLMRPDGGTIHVNGERIDTMPEEQLLHAAQRRRACASRRTRCSTR